MKTPDTTSLQHAAFLEGESLKVAGMTVRQFSVGTLNVCRSMGLSMFTEDAVSPATLTTTEKQQQTMAFAWASAAPLDEVLDAVDGGTWKRKVQEFEFKLEISALPAFMAAINTISRRAAAAAVKTVPRSSGGSEETPPGN